MSLGSLRLYALVAICSVLLTLGQSGGSVLAAESDGLAIQEEAVAEEESPVVIPGALTSAATTAVVIAAAADQLPSTVPMVDRRSFDRDGDSLEARTQGIDVSIPRDPGAPIELNSAPPSGPRGPSQSQSPPALSISLPQTDSQKAAKIAPDGTVVYADADGEVDLAVQAFDDGSIRAQAVIQVPDAPTTYNYDLGLPEGVALQTQTTGGILLVSDGVEVGQIEAPWAIDANGRRLPTHYAVVGNRVTQVVDHAGREVAYPVVSDPKLRWNGWGRWQVFLSSKETNDISIAGGGLAAVLATAGPAGVILGGLSGLTAAAIAIGRNHGLCVVVNGWLSTPVGVASYRCKNYKFM